MELPKDKFTRANVEYHVDISTGQVLIGQAALNAALEAGGHSFVEPLGPVLRRSDINLPHQRVNPRINGWSKEEILTSLMWLNDIVPPPTKPKEKTINETIIRNAAHLGLIASVHQIKHPSRYGSMANLYKEAELVNTHRTFGELSDDDLIDYVANLIDEFGRLPTADEIRGRAREDVTLPNYETLYNRIGGIIPAAEKRGFVLPRYWPLERHIRWEVEFYVANDLQHSSQRTKQILSVMGNGPSHTLITRKFKSESTFKERSDQEFKTEYEKMSMAIEEGIIPRSVIKYVTSPQLMIGRYVRHGLVEKFLSVDSFLQANTDDLKETIVLADLPDGDFLELLKQSQGWSEEAFKETIEAYGVFQNMWRYDYINSLNLEIAVKNKLGMHKYQPRNPRMEKVINGAVNSLREKGLSTLVPGRINFLRQNGTLPDPDVFNSWFSDEHHFRLIVQAKLRRKNENPKIAIARNLARKRLENVYLIHSEYQQFIGGAGVKDITTLENGEVVVDLAPQSRGRHPVKPGTALAASIIEKIRKDLDNPKKKTYTIRNTRGRDVRREWRDRDEDNSRDYESSDLADPQTF